MPKCNKMPVHTSQYIACSIMQHMMHTALDVTTHTFQSDLFEKETERLKRRGERISCIRWVPVRAAHIMYHGLLGISSTCFLPLLHHRNQHHMKQRHHVNHECQSICNLVCLQGWIMWPQSKCRPARLILPGCRSTTVVFCALYFPSSIDNLLEHAGYSSDKDSNYCVSLQVFL